MRTGSRILALWIILFSTGPFAYELGTHARITEKSYLQSIVYTDDGLRSDYGFNHLDVVEPPVKVYHEMVGGGILERNGLEFVLDRDLNLFPFNLRGNSYSIQGWLMRGAIREDDYQNQSFLLGLCQVKGAPPIPAQENPLSRPVNHFYDPVNDRGLAAGQPATDWALGTADALQVPNQPDAGRANHYTIVDAREVLYRVPSVWISGPVPEKGFAQNNAGVVMPPWYDDKCPWKGSGSGRCSAGSIEGGFL